MSRFAREHPEDFEERTEAFMDSVEFNEQMYRDMMQDAAEGGDVRQPGRRDVTRVVNPISSGPGGRPAGTPPPAAPGNCKICGRELKDWRTCAADDPACDCGGDCRKCMDEVEGVKAERDRIR